MKDLINIEIMNIAYKFSNIFMEMIRLIRLVQFCILYGIDT